HDGALIVAEQHALAVAGIDPQLLRIVAAGRALEAGEGVAAVGGLVARRVDGVDNVGIPGVHVHAAVVAALAVADARVGRVHLTPRSAAVVGAIQPRVLDQEHALRVRVVRDRDRCAARESRQPATGYFFPGDAFVGRLEQMRLAAAPCRPCTAPASWSNETRRTRRRRIPVAHGGREQDAGLVIGPRDLLRAGRVVHVERLGPRAAAVDRAIDAARVALLVDVA